MPHTLAQYLHDAASLHPSEAIRDLDQLLLSETIQIQTSGFAKYTIKQIKLACGQRHLFMDSEYSARIMHEAACDNLVD